jgi:hypothetical protein
MQAWGFKKVLIYILIGLPATVWLAKWYRSGVYCACLLWCRFATGKYKDWYALPYGKP